MINDGLFDYNLIDIVPSNIVDDETKAFMHAVDHVIIDKIYPAILKLRIWSDIFNADSNLLDYLAAESRTQYYDENLSDDIKKNLINNTLMWYQKAGTNHAIKELIGIIFGDGDIQEWDAYNGNPYHFKIVTDNPNITDDDIDQFNAIIKNVKRKSTILDKLEISMSASMNLYMGISLQVGDYINIKQEG